MANPLFMNPGYPTCRICHEIIDDPQWDQYEKCSHHLTENDLEKDTDQ